MTGVDERALYRDRAFLIAVLAAGFETHWAEPDPADPYAADYRLICLHTPAGQLTWHIHPDDAGLFPADLPTRPSDWDGHTTTEKQHRLAALARPGGVMAKRLISKDTQEAVTIAGPVLSDGRVLVQDGAGCIAVVNVADLAVVDGSSDDAGQDSRR
ncbi:hypothetical protein [Candidatus Frankia alpina]|uniref:WDGH domain-containing protein n=1 Tax=Candidatus Frankia alpina TaxID=2699483 RepID=A0A4S5ES56_9ACTN|nr:hypothetical protein [Candidatus Frankia alpina]THJ74932.1 hypothetical protein E7Y31_08425 [Candidatus Frankia alpina]